MGPAVEFWWCGSRSRGVGGGGISEGGGSRRWGGSRGVGGGGIYQGGGDLPGGVDPAVWRRWVPQFRGGWSRGVGGVPK